MRLPRPADSGSAGIGPPWRRTRYWSITTWLIAVNAAVYVADVLLNGELSDWGQLSGAGIAQVKVWLLLSYQFLHAGPFHLLFNMLWLWFLGPLVEWRLGRRRYLLFYLLCGIAGGAVFLLQAWAQEMTHGIPSALVGASAGVFGVMAGAVVLAPRMRLHMWFPPVTISLRAMFWIMVGLALLTLYTGGFNAGGEAAHLGGAAMGALLIRRLHWLSMAEGRRQRHQFWKPGDPSSNFFRGDSSRY